MQFKRWTVDHGCDNQFCAYKDTSRRQSICFLTVKHCFTLVQSRVQDKRYRCHILESTQHMEQDSNMTEADWIQTSRRTNNQSTLPHVCSSQTNFVSWPSRPVGVLEWSSCRYWNTVSFLKRPRRNAATHSCTRKRICSLTNGGPQMLEDVKEPMLARSATLRDPGTRDQIVMEQQQSDTLSESVLVQDVRIPRTRFTT